MRSFVRGCGLLALAVLLLLSLASLFAPSRTPAFGGSPLSSHPMTVVEFPSSSSVVGRPSLSAAFLNTVLAAYGSPAAGTGHFAVFDADSLDGLVQLLGVQRRLSADGIDSALEGSRRGGHLRVFFASAVVPSLVRRWLLPYCPDGVEFYPKRDWATWEEPGSLMRVPFGVHRLSGRRYPFLVAASSGDRVVPVAQSVAASLDWLATIRRVPVPLLEQTTVGLRDGSRVLDTNKFLAKGGRGGYVVAC